MHRQHQCQSALPTYYIPSSPYIPMGSPGFIPNPHNQYFPNCCTLHSMLSSLNCQNPYQYQSSYNSFPNINQNASQFIRYQEAPSMYGPVNYIGSDIRGFKIKKNIGHVDIAKRPIIPPSFGYSNQNNIQAPEIKSISERQSSHASYNGLSSSTSLFEPHKPKIAPPIINDNVTQYKITKIRDENTNINCKSISAMNEFEGTSIEELRFKDLQTKDSDLKLNKTSLFSSNQKSSFQDHNQLGFGQSIQVKAANQLPETVPNHIKTPNKMHSFSQPALYSDSKAEVTKTSSTNTTGFIPIPFSDGLNHPKNSSEFFQTTNISEFHPHTKLPSNPGCLQSELSESIKIIKPLSQSNSTRLFTSSLFGGPSSQNQEQNTTIIGQSSFPESSKITDSTDLNDAKTGLINQSMTQLQTNASFPTANSLDSSKAQTELGSQLFSQFKTINSLGINQTMNQSNKPPVTLFGEEESSLPAASSLFNQAQTGFKKPSVAQFAQEKASIPTTSSLGFNQPQTGFKNPYTPLFGKELASLPSSGSLFINQAQTGINNAPGTFPINNSIGFKQAQTEFGGFTQNLTTNTIKTSSG